MKARFFGEIPGIPEGSEFENRLFLSEYGVHRPLQAGISGSQTEGADSIVLSGGYEDDEDLGDVIIYTGHGGRSLETGLQVTDQQLVRQNLALALNCQRGLPVRVIRGYTHKSSFSPLQGYRYDGLFRVDSYWRGTGRSGFIVWRFRLVKLDTSTPRSVAEEDRPAYGISKRVESTVQRIVKNTELAHRVKEIHEYRCQVCRTQLITTSGLYAEAAHIQPLGRPHNGPDTLSNILCLCPNHHVMFDFGGFGVANNLRLIGLDGRLFTKANHRLAEQYLQYHREHFLLNDWQ